MNQSRMKSFYITFGTAIALILTSAPVQSQALMNGTVVSIGDGDTITVQDWSGMKTRVRLACIDSPEMSQAPYGEQSRSRLQVIIPVGTAIAIKPKTTDRYGRTVAEVFKGTLNVNLVLVQEGRAVAYRQYLGQCDRDKYLQAEASAKSQSLAFWNQPSPVMPWDYRRGVRAKTVQPIGIPKPQAASSHCDRSYPTVCIPSAPPDLNCGDIPHRRFKVVGADPHRFDGDRDGIGCER